MLEIVKGGVMVFLHPVLNKTWNVPLSNEKKLLRLIEYRERYTIFFLVGPFWDTLYDDIIIEFDYESDFMFIKNKIQTRSIEIDIFE
jgi:hypothetical protein